MVTIMKGIAGDIETSTITSKYQTVIPAPIRRRAGIKKNAELVWQIIQEGEYPMMMVSPKPSNWTKYLSGLGKNVWEGITVEKYIGNLKKEWKK